ncbi:MAG: HAMP domain-containing protein [Planctomycetota bacterium]
MLRHKLLIQLFCMTALLIGLAVLAIWVLENISVDYEKTNANTEALVAHCGELNKTAEMVESYLYDRQNGNDTSIDELLIYMSELTSQIAKIDLTVETADTEAVADLQEVVEDLSGMAVVTDSFDVATDTEMSQSKELIARIHSHSLSMMLHALEVNRVDQKELNSRFRMTLIVIAIGFLATINICILLLLRTGLHVLRPVDLLVDSCRQLVEKRFDTRVKSELDGEFAILAETYNNLAQQLQDNETNRIDTIKQVALAINHELNNTLATIDLELQLLKRRTQGDEQFDQQVAEIEKNLRRMAKTVATLGNIRRIVLTDYLSGTKMLDLDQSAQPEISVTADMSDVSTSATPTERPK